MFRSLLYDHPQGLSFALSAFTTFPLLASSFAFKGNIYKTFLTSFIVLINVDVKSVF
jgi:hypothetical protein